MPRSPREITVQQALDAGVGELYLTAIVPNFRWLVDQWPDSYVCGKSAKGTPMTVKGAKQIEALLDYLEHLESRIDNGVGLLCVGGYGCGKTYFASLALLEALKLGYRCHFTTTRQMFDNYLADDLGTRQEWIEHYTGVHLLVIDDLGKEHRGQSGFFEANFDNLLRERVRHKRATIITTNLDAQKFLRVYQESVAQLLFEALWPVYFPPVNVRETLAANALKREVSGE